MGQMGQRKNCPHFSIIWVHLCIDKQNVFLYVVFGTKTHLTLPICVYFQYYYLENYSYRFFINYSNSFTIPEKYGIFVET